MFRPTSGLNKPITFSVKPAEHHALGTNFKRGDARRVISRSELLDFGQCPSKWVRGGRNETTDEMAWGSLIDCLLLTPSLFEQTYAIAPETYPCEPTKKDPRTEKPWNWNATYCDEWRQAQEAAGKTVVKPTTASAAWSAIARLKEDPEIADLLSQSKTQVQVCVDWHDEATGLVVPVKALLDIVPDPAGRWGTTLADLKTTNSAESRAWLRTVHSFALHYQAALYMDAMNAASGLKYEEWHHVIQEKEAPFEVALRALSDDFILIGRNAYQSDLRRYCQCLAHNTWPGYSREIVEPEAWMLRD